jgi:hypothetical protein
MTACDQVPTRRKVRMVRAEVIPPFDLFIVIHPVLPGWLAELSHCDNHVALLLARLDVAVRRDHLLQRIDAVYGRAEVTRLGQIPEEA